MWDMYGIRTILTVGLLICDCGAKIACLLEVLIEEN